MTYRATLTAEFQIEAENIAQARRVTAKIRSIGERVGCRREVHERDAVSYAVTRLYERLTVRRSKP